MNEPVLHFGLGGHDTVRTLRIRWPSGTVDVHRGLPAGTRYLATEAGEIVPDR